MLSRLASASKVGARVFQIARPSRQLLCTSSKVFAENEPLDIWNPKVEGDVVIAGLSEPYVGTDEKPRTIWQQYKDFAGESAGPVFVGGAVLMGFSKELLIINAESYLACLMAFSVWVMIRYAKPDLQAWWDKSQAEELAKLNRLKERELKAITDNLDQIKAVEDLLAARFDIMQALKNREDMKREVQHRENLAEVEQEVKKRLDYQLDLQELKNKIEHEHIADWVTKEVVKSITPQQEQEAIAQCLAEIEALAHARHA